MLSKRTDGRLADSPSGITDRGPAMVMLLVSLSSSYCYSRPSISQRFCTSLSKVDDSRVLVV